jgi:hypothetical protein
MFKSIDIKSALIGGLAVALAISSISAVGYVAQDGCDRFELVAGSGAGFTFLLDNVTGQVWAVRDVVPIDGIVTTSHGDEEFYAPKVDGLMVPVTP